MIDELLAGASTEEEIAGPGGLLAELTKRLVERALEVELTDMSATSRIGAARRRGNTRNGTTPKTLITEHGKVEIDAARDRDGSFEPQIVRSASAASRGSTTRSSRCTRAAVDARYGGAPRGDLRREGRPRPDLEGDRRGDGRRREWAKRPLEDIYPIVFLDCMVLKIREGGSVQRRALYLALGVTLEGDRDVLGMWFQETEGAKFWMQVLNDLKKRGVQDI